MHRGASPHTGVEKKVYMRVGCYVILLRQVENREPVAVRMQIERVSRCVDRLKTMIGLQPRLIGSERGPVVV